MVLDGAEKSGACQIYNNVPKHIWMEARKYTLAHSTKDAVAKFQSNMRSIRSNERP